MLTPIFGTWNYPCPVAAKSVLLVDSDTRSQRVLEVSLKKAGFEVMCARSVEDALTLASGAVPEIVLTEAELVGGSGYDLARRLRDDQRTKSVAIVFLAQDGTPESKIRAISAGADDYLTKPMFVKEILTRLGGLLERRQKEALSKKDRPANFSGTLGGMGLVDLFQLIETGRKTCTLRLTSDGPSSGGFVESGVLTGAIHFKDGRAIDAEIGRLRGEPAIYRFLLWDDGGFEVDFVPPDAPSVTVHTPTQALLLEGMRRIDEWARVAAGLPRLSTRLDVDFRALGAHVNGIPEEVDGVVRLFDGRRSILNVLDESPADDLATLSIVARLVADKILVDQRGSRNSIPAPGISLESWLTTRTSAEPPPPAAEPEHDLLANLPSELGAAMIPSQETASHILAAADPTAQAARPPEQKTVRPEPLPDELAAPSAVLSRSTVPATSTTPGVMLSSLQPPPPASAVPMPVQTVELRRSIAPSATDPGARLSVRRVGSSVAPPSTIEAAPAPKAVETPPPVAAPAAPAAVPAAPPPSTSPAEALDDAFDAGDAIIDSAPTTPAGARPRRQPRGATFRTVRRPSVVTKDGANGAASESYDTEIPAPEPEEEVENTQVDAPRSEVTPIFEDAVPPPPPPATQIPTMAHEAPPRAAFATAPASRTDLDAEFAKLQHTYEEQAPQGSWGRRLLILGVLLIGIGWVYVLMGEQKRIKADPKAPVISPVAITAAPTPAWPSIGDETSTAARAAKTATGATSPQLAPVVSVTPSPTPAAVAQDDGGELDKGTAALKARRFEAAKAAFTKAVERVPANADAHAGLAHALYELQSAAAAQAEAKKALDLGPSNARANLVLGLIAYDRQKNQEAGGYLKRYLELAPSGEHAADVKMILKSL